MLDGGLEFIASMNGRPLAELELRPSEYFRRQVRVSAFSYELPERLRTQGHGFHIRVVVVAHFVKLREKGIVVVEIRAALFKNLHDFQRW